MRFILRERRVFFQFKVLPFGLATAGWIFTKVLRQLRKHWRRSLIQVVVFLDDGLQTNKCLSYQRMSPISRMDSSQEQVMLGTETGGGLVRFHIRFDKRLDYMYR